MDLKENKTLSLSSVLIKLLCGIGIIVSLYSILIGCVQGLWNIFMPEVFNVKPLTFIQSASLVILLHLLFASSSFWISKK